MRRTQERGVSELFSDTEAQDKTYNVKLNEDVVLSSFDDDLIELELLRNNFMPIKSKNLFVIVGLLVFTNLLLAIMVLVG